MQTFLQYAEDHIVAPYRLSHLISIPSWFSISPSTLAVFCTHWICSIFTIRLIFHWVALLTFISPSPHTHALLCVLKITLPEVPPSIWYLFGYIRNYVLLTEFTILNSSTQKLKGSECLCSMLFKHESTCKMWCSCLKGKCSLGMD